MKRYIVIAGGGKVGYYLARTLVASGYLVGVIETDAEQAATIASDLGITVILGDATELETLHDAEVEEARYLVALTGSDEANLAVCQMAKSRFGVRKTVARVVNPRNEALYKRLGVDATICTTAMAAETIEKALPAEGMRLSAIFSQGDVEMAEVELPATSPVIGKSLAELSLPADCLLIALIRAGAVSFPRGRTAFQSEDRVFALARLPAVEDLRKALLGDGR